MVEKLSPHPSKVLCILLTWGLLNYIETKLQTTCLYLK